MDNGKDDDGGLEYLERLDAYLNGTTSMTCMGELQKRGFTPPAPDEVSDADMNTALTNVIWALYDLHVEIDDADHLSDRELYTALYEYLGEDTMVFPDIPNATTHWSPIGSCTDEDMQVYLRYYADDQRRLEWAKEYPEDPMPSSELPPHFRSWMPQRRVMGQC
jgi:hypothetical protein